MARNDLGGLPNIQDSTAIVEDNRAVANLVGVTTYNAIGMNRRSWANFTPETVR